MKKDIRTEGAALYAPVETKTVQALLSDTARLTDDRVAKLSKEHNLQSGARRVLACLAVKDGVSQLDLIRATHLKAPTISLIVQKMEHDGIITRKTDDIDMRLTRVYLTDTGEKINRSVCDTIKAVEDTAMADFTEEEKALLHGMLVRMYKNMEAGADE